MRRSELTEIVTRKGDHEAVEGFDAFEGEIRKK
jgi:hypothetical protein